MREAILITAFALAILLAIFGCATRSAPSVFEAQGPTEQQKMACDDIASETGSWMRRCESAEALCFWVNDGGLQCAMKGGT